MAAEAACLGLFEGYGVELEYMIVDAETLDVRPIADRVIAAEHGSIDNEIERGAFAWSNELARHVIEFKTNGPAAGLAGLAEGFEREVARSEEILAPLGARLLPTAMHPWMDPARELDIWPHGGREIYAAFTRLLVDLLRSPHNPRMFSSITRGLPLEERRELLERHHAPYWQRVRENIVQLRGTGRSVVHLGVHAFAPVLAGVRRDFEVGLLYDPRRGGERVLARSWQKRLRRSDPELGVRLNAPYRGEADGLATALRRDFGPRAHLGLELELNQRALAQAGRRRALLALIAELLAAE